MIHLLMVLSEAVCGPASTVRFISNAAERNACQKAMFAR